MENIKEDYPEILAQDLHSRVLKLMYEMKQYKSAPEYKTIQMNLTTVCRELNTITIKEITGEQDAPVKEEL